MKIDINARPRQKSMALAWRVMKGSRARANEGTLGDSRRLEQTWRLIGKKRFSDRSAVLFAHGSSDRARGRACPKIGSHPGSRPRQAFSRSRSERAHREIAQPQIAE